MNLSDLTVSARSGNVSSQTKLADCYFYGTDGCFKDYYTAAYWYEEAARHGNAYAQYSIGYCYQSGLGVTKNDVTALTWFREAAKRGNGSAMYCLGEYYEKGIVVNQNDDMAFDWYEKAFDAEYVRAAAKLGDIFYYGHLKTEIDYDAAAKCYAMGVDKGDAYCTYSLGYCLQYGKGIRQDLDLAVKLYRIAAQKGNTSAKNALSKLGY